MREGFEMSALYAWAAPTGLEGMGDGVPQGVALGSGCGAPLGLGGGSAAAER